MKNSQKTQNSVVELMAPASETQPRRVIARPIGSPDDDAALYGASQRAGVSDYAFDGPPCLPGLLIMPVLDLNFVRGDEHFSGPIFSLS